MPDRETMEEFLANHYISDEDDDVDCNFDMQEAIYWFATNYHEGQDSSLYEALSTSQFKPSPMSHGPDSEGSKHYYYLLVDKFAKIGR